MIWNINEERPTVEVATLNHSEEDKEFFNHYFQHNFLWTYIMGSDCKYFCSDYTTEHNYVQQSPIVQRIWMKLADAFDIHPCSQVGRCYLLGQTENLDGPWHDDYDRDENPNIRTIVYYPIANPHRQHRGTAFEIGDEEQEYAYQQDTALFFDASCPHRGYSTTSRKSLRVSLVFQCIDVNTIHNAPFVTTAGNDERLDGVISPIIP